MAKQYDKEFKEQVIQYVLDWYHVKFEDNLNFCF
jgi:hypothetical protein